MLPRPKSCGVEKPQPVGNALGHGRNGGLSTVVCRSVGGVTEGWARGDGSPRRGDCPSGRTACRSRDQVESDADDRTTGTRPARRRCASGWLSRVGAGRLRRAAFRWRARSGCAEQMQIGRRRPIAQGVGGSAGSSSSASSTTEPAAVNACGVNITMDAPAVLLAMCWWSVMMAIRSCRSSLMSSSVAIADPSRHVAPIAAPKIATINAANAIHWSRFICTSSRRPSLVTAWLLTPQCDRYACHDPTNTVSPQALAAVRAARIRASHWVRA